MKEHPASSTVNSRRNRAPFCFALAGFVAVVGGCSMRNNKSRIPWHTAVLVRPISPPRSAPRAVDAGPVPDLKLEFPPQPIRFPVLSVPARPHVPATAHAPGNNEVATKPEQPSITPQLPPAEAQALQQQMDKSVSAAERNLAATNGKSLNTAQSDLASKVRSFLADSREAAKEGDLRRANNLAKKAQVLSEELAGSL